MANFLDAVMKFNSFLMNKELTIPASQMVYFLGLINILMLVRRYRLSYLVSLIFALYWLLILNKNKFTLLQGEFATQGWVLMAGVLVVLVIALFCFLSQSRD